jgi:hypothetical protein
LIACARRFAMVRLTVLLRALTSPRHLFGLPPLLVAKL